MTLGPRQVVPVHEHLATADVPFVLQRHADGHRRKRLLNLAVTGDNRLDPATPIAGLYLVGMDVKGSGVAGDLIPLGVRRLLDALDCSF